ncbi:MAG: hypothetical protein JWQ22_159 [Devosia sp.]|nr:hypothetical protein [Devosia sp.]
MNFTQTCPHPASPSRGEVLICALNWIVFSLKSQSTPSPLRGGIKGGGSGPSENSTSGWANVTQTQCLPDFLP